MSDLTILNESAVAVTFGNSIDLETHHRVMAFRRAVLNEPFPGLLDVVPAYASVTVFFDPVDVKRHFPEHLSPAGAVLHLLENLYAGLGMLPNQPITVPTDQPILQIPVRYNGPDLTEVAGRLGLSENEVIELHSGAVYTVFMTGFLPGFPYLGPLPAALELPRRDEPRLRVPAGSVAIAGRQTGIYPQASPGGWHLIGNTEVKLFDSALEPPALLQPGMRVRFVDAGGGT